MPLGDVLMRSIQTHTVMRMFQMYQCRLPGIQAWRLPMRSVRVETAPLTIIRRLHTKVDTFAEAREKDVLNLAEDGCVCPSLAVQ